MGRCSTVPIFYDAGLFFDFVPLFWRELELKKHSRRYILWQRKQYLESQFRSLWIWFTHSSPEPRKWHFMKNIMFWWIDHKIGPGTSSRILVIAKEVENWFRKNASSSSLSWENYHWNSVSRDWRWSITDVFKFLARSSVFSTTFDNFSNTVRFFALLYEVSFATSNKNLVDSLRSWMIFATFPFSLNLSKFNAVAGHMWPAGR